MEDFDLGRQLGPLPLGGWLLAIGGGLALSFFFNRNQPDDDPGSRPDEAGDILGGRGLVRGPSDPIYLVDDSPQAPAPSQPDPDGDAANALTDNYAWERAGVELLVARGVSGTTAQDALARYLTGEPVTTEQRNLVDRVVRELGPPPQPVPPLRTTTQQPTPDEPDEPAPTSSTRADRLRAMEQRVRDLFTRYGVALATGSETAAQRVARLAREQVDGVRTWAELEAAVRRLAERDQAPAPTPRTSGGTTYTVRTGDTLWGIAGRFYGNPQLWTLLWDANKPMRSGNPNLIYPGERITVPAR